VAGHGGDDEPGAAGSDHAAELLQHQSGAEQVDGEDGRRGRLNRRHAGGVDELGDVAQLGRLLGERVDRLA
jgi:hypothetical protein